MSAPRVVVSPHNVAGYLEGGGHFWAYAQHVQGLRALGCDVWWLERLRGERERAEDAHRIAVMTERLAALGIQDRLLLYEINDGKVEWIAPGADRAERIVRDADLLLNVYYAMPSEMLSRFRRTALLDIDPGLLQHWVSNGDLRVEPHDVYLTIGETVGTPQACFPDCGLDWVHVGPAVSLDDWHWSDEPGRSCLTSVSSWWGGEWISDGDGNPFDNNKRVSFLELLELPRLTDVPLELSLYTRGDPDVDDIRLLERNGWIVRHTLDTVSTPDAYRDYIRGSLGELSAAKPSCMLFQNAWVSDRTLCYLASGRPAVVQNTGPSELLDGRDGLLRFSTVEQAAAAVERLSSDYELHRQAARELAEQHFDAGKVARRILDAALR